MDFASLHDLLRSTYDEMMPLCSDMTGVAKGIAGLGALFYMGFACPCRGNRRVSAPTSLCDWFLHYVFPYDSAWHNEWRTLPNRQGYGNDGGQAGGDACQTYSTKG